MRAILEITEDKLDREPAVADRNDQEPVDRPEIAISINALRKSDGELNAVNNLDDMRWAHPPDNCAR